MRKVTRKMRKDWGTVLFLPTQDTREWEAGYSPVPNFIPWTGFWGSRRGRVPPWQQKKNGKNLEEGENQEKRGKKIRKKRKNREGSFSLPLLTDRAGCATALSKIITLRCLMIFEPALGLKMLVISHQKFQSWGNYYVLLKRCGMGPWLVLVSHCFRESVVATCKIGSFLCSLDNLLQKNLIFLFFGNQISKWRSFEKRAIFDLLFTLFRHQGKVTKIPSAHISLTYIHAFCSPYWLFLPYQFWKKNTNLSDTVSLWYES